MLKLDTGGVSAFRDEVEFELRLKIWIERQSALSCHAKTTRSGGSQTRTFPQSHSAPFSPTSNQRPPGRPSTTISFCGDALMLWEGFHHRPMRLVKTSKACSWLALTRISSRTGA